MRTTSLGFDFPVFNFKSYHSNHIFLVEFKLLADGFKSCFQKVDEGVPQESIIGSLLFALDINYIDFPTQPCDARLCTDDIFLYAFGASANRPSLDHRLLSLINRPPCTFLKLVLNSTQKIKSVHVTREQTIDDPSPYMLRFRIQ